VKFIKGLFVNSVKTWKWSV